jgi:hypothetical protein
MVKTTIPAGEADSLREFLHAVSAVDDLPASVRDACQYWAHRVWPDTQRQSLQQVAWLLQSAGEHRWMSADYRKEASWWSARLERGW